MIPHQGWIPGATRPGLLAEAGQVLFARSGSRRHPMLGLRDFSPKLCAFFGGYYTWSNRGTRKPGSILFSSEIEIGRLLHLPGRCCNNNHP